MQTTKIMATARSTEALPNITPECPRPESGRREIFRTTLFVALAVTVATLLVSGSFLVGTHLVAAWWLESHQGMVTWDINGTNWRQGGVTSVSFGPRNFGFSRLEEADLKHLHKLHRVVSVNLGECDGISNKGLAVLRGLDFLVELNLDRLGRYRHLRFGGVPAPLTDACLVHVQTLPRLEVLTLSGNLITDNGLSRITGMTSLKTLDLSVTEVTDVGLDHLARMKSLKVVNLGATRVTKQGIAQLQMARPDLIIEIDVDPAVEQAVKQTRGEIR